MSYIYETAEKAVEEHGTRNPYELLRSLGAKTMVSHSYGPGGLKGYCAIVGGLMVVMLNGHMSDCEKRIVAGHEAAHLILHRTELMGSPTRTLEDYSIYSSSAGRMEREANSFLADFLLSDQVVVEAISDLAGDYFACASELEVPPEVLSFKLDSMRNRGFDVCDPVGLNSGFLGDG